MQAADRGLKDLLIGHGQAERGRARARGVLPVVEELVARAQAEGELRPDVSARDLPMVSLMLGQVIEFSHDQAPELWRRYLALLLDGLRGGGERDAAAGAAHDSAARRGDVGVAAAPSLSGTTLEVRADEGRDVQGDAALGGAAAGDVRGGGWSSAVMLPCQRARVERATRRRGTSWGLLGSGERCIADGTGGAVRTSSRGSPIFGRATAFGPPPYPAGVDVVPAESAVPARRAASWARERTPSFA